MGEKYYRGATMSIRLNFTVEGTTEETFVNQVLVPHLADSSVWACARRVLTKRKQSRSFRGGMTTYVKAKNDIERWMKEDQNPYAFFTTMFDLYALPNDFPGYGDAKAITDPWTKVAKIEEEFRNEINDQRFIPYIQLYEFEALLFSDPEKFNVEYPDRVTEIKKLNDIVESSGGPETIDDGPETAPSKRIIREIPEYKGMKASAGPIIAAKIGLNTLRAKCPHFKEWLNKLENLTNL